MGIVITGDVESPELQAAISAAFAAWVSSIATALAEKGLTAEQSTQLATMVVIGVEGAIVLARAQRNGDAFAELGRSIPLLYAGLSAQGGR